MGAVRSGAPRRGERSGPAGAAAAAPDPRRPAATGGTAGRAVERDPGTRRARGGLRPTGCGTTCCVGSGAGRSPSDSLPSPVAAAAALILGLKRRRRTPVARGSDLAGAGPGGLGRGLRPARRLRDDDRTRVDQPPRRRGGRGRRRRCRRRAAADWHRCRARRRSVPVSTATRRRTRWRASDVIERAVLEPRSRWSRLRCRLSTRSLRRRTGSPITAATRPAPAGPAPAFVATAGP